MNVIESLEKSAKETVVKGIVEMIDKNPEKNVERIFAAARKLTKDKDHQARIDFVENYYKTNQATHDFILDILAKTDKSCLKHFITNFFANAAWYAMPKREKYLVDENTKIPFVMLISPSMRCNKRCIGCYAAEYDKNSGMKFEDVDRLVGEARDLGVYFFIILGGEPFFNEFMLDIYKKYNDCMFVAFTNGTLFNAELADKLQKLGNVVPMFSLEGFEKETDARRGAGTFNKVMEGMDLLRERGILFGVSSATARNNMDTVTSDEFIDMLIKKGSRMSWYFMYMPIGDKPDLNLMLTPEQRIELGKRTNRLRKTKPYFTIDFFNDAPYVGGCISGKYYCHINSNFDVEPCIFAHFACDNVKNKPLIEAFRGPFFKELRSRQPYNKNLLMPCMMIDNPTQIREIVAKTGAHATDPSCDNMLSNPEFMKQLDEYAENYKPVADKAWKELFNETGNYKMSKG